jgi:hypothetical protein
MSKNSFIFFTILWILIQVLVEVDCQMIPSKIYRHTATLIDNKLYILSGWLVSNDKPVKEFFYLDVSVPFDTQKLPWKDLTNVNTVPLHDSATSAKGGANNNTLFLYGGYTDNPTMVLVYTFDSQNTTWSAQKIPEFNRVRKYELTGVMSHNGKFYLWNGNIANGISREMLILNTINLNWEIGSLINAPTARFNYGATLLPNNKIIYIGKRVIFILYMYC